MTDLPIARKEFGSGRAAEVWPLLLGRARLLLVDCRSRPYPDLLDSW
jgi:hypothetical protein